MDKSGKILTGAACEAGNARLFPEHLIYSLWGVHDFIHSLHYIPVHYILLNLSVLGLCLRIKDYGLFVWINLTALSRTYLIYGSETVGGGGGYNNHCVHPSQQDLLWPHLSNGLSTWYHSTKGTT